MENNYKIHLITENNEHICDLELNEEELSIIVEIGIKAILQEFIDKS